jgi:hypothetical protein
MWMRKPKEYAEKVKKLAEKTKEHVPSHVVIPHPDSNPEEHKRQVAKIKLENGPVGDLCVASFLFSHTQSLLTPTHRCSWDDDDGVVAGDSDDDGEVEGDDDDDNNGSGDDDD